MKVYYLTLIQCSSAAINCVRNRMFRRRVVKKVTACPHNVSSGSSSAAITGSRNMIFCHSVVKKVTACHHGSSSTEINATAIMTPATGVKKATACHDIVGGSSSTEIDVTTNMFPGTVVTGTNSTVSNQRKVGFQHVYKSLKTNSSRRVNAAYKNCVRNGAPRSSSAMRRDKAKMRKIASLPQAVSSAVHSFGRSFLSDQQVFFSGTQF